MKTNWFLNRFIAIGTILLVSISSSYSQKTTQVRGKVINAKTREPLPFVNIAFVDRNIGTITDYNGEFRLESQWASNKLQASFIGYHPLVKNIVVEKNQLVNFQLEAVNIELNEVTVISKKKRYKNKGNPAVELVKKVIENKDKNRKESLDFFEYDKYEKVEFDLNNITEKFRNKKVFKEFQFVFNYVDTSEINGKPYLAVFLQETLSKVYYRKSPKSQKEYVSGSTMVGSKDYVDSDGANMMIDYLYQDIDLYDNNIMMLTNQFISPLSDISPIIYKFRIMDTIDVNGHNCINLAFQPRNKLDFAFVGNLYITNDDRYALIKADMRVSEDINLNFVNDLKIIQEFEFANNQCWMLTRDDLVIDFNIGTKGAGMFGKRSVYYDNYIFNKTRQDSTYSGIENTIKEIGYSERDEEFWQNNRLKELSEQEQNIYNMVDSVQSIPAFKRTMDVMMLLIAGYWNFGNVDIGPVNTFYSFNDVEGFRLRIGGKTSTKFSKRLRLEGYLLYGSKDEQYKYSGSATWSLNKNSLNESPEHSIMIMYQDETNFPGMEMQFINEDNFLLSFKRGEASQLLYYKMLNIEHRHDWGNGFSTRFDIKHAEQTPGGTLSFNYIDHSVNKIITSEFSTILRFAPNEKYYQGVNYRSAIITKQPIFQFSYTQGVKGLLNSDFNYGKLTFNGFKRFYIPPLGFTNFELDAGKLFGSGIPYPLMYIHRANQTYSYQLHSYNLMNFLEFVSDEYVSIYADHNFYGFFFNKIPLLKQMKLREIISVKGIFGTVTDKNNPEMSSEIMLFPTGINGEQTTFTLKNKPYAEASVGVGNIFKVFRVDLVKRITYLDHPNVSEYGIRARFKFDF